MEKWKDSGLSEHAGMCNKSIKWDDIKVLSKQSNYYKRSIRESLEIKLRKSGPNDTNGMNRDQGKYVTTNSWEPIFDKIRYHL